MKLSFKSVRDNYKYDCVLNSISELDNNIDRNMRKFYILNVVPKESYIKPFGNYFENRGDILMYIYHSISEDISEYIPFRYTNGNYLTEYEKLLKNPDIHNEQLFGLNCSSYDISSHLKTQYNSDTLITTDLLNIDIPKNNSFMCLINNVKTLEECKIQIEKDIITYKNNKYLWRFTHNKNIILEHLKVVYTTFNKIDNKVYIGSDLVKVSDIILIANKYYLLYKNVIF